jgi:hypothetical protein
MKQRHTSKRFLISLTRGKKKHRANIIIPIAETTSEVSGFESKASHDLSRRKKRQLLKEYGLQVDAILNKNNLPCKHILNFYILINFFI